MGKDYKLNHLLYMDDLKLFAKSEKQIDTLVRTVHVFSTDIGMEFGMKKCGILTMKRRRVVRCEGVMLPNNEVMKEVEKEGYTYLGIVELDKIKEDEMKKKTIKEYKRRLRLILRSKPNRKNKIHGQWRYSDMEQEYYSGKRVNWKAWIGYQGKQWQCMEHYIRRAMWTDCTLRGKREVEAWWVWNVALEKKKIVWVFMLPVLKKTSLREFMQLRQSTKEDNLTSGEFKKTDRTRT